MARVFKALKNGTKFSVDETRAVPMSIDGVQGKFAVYSKRTSGTGTATLGLYGSFKSSTSDTTDRIQITAPASMGTGSLTAIQTVTDEVFPWVVLVYDVTGTAEFEVYISQL